MPGSGMKTPLLIAIIVTSVGAVATGMIFASRHLLNEASPYAAYTATSDAAARTFGEGIAAESATGETAFIDAAFELELAIRQAMCDIAMPPRQRDGFIAGVRNGQRNAPSYGKQMLASVGADAAVRFLRAHQVDGGQRVLVRYLGEGGVNYIDYLVRDDPSGQTRIIDNYSFGTGELFSQTMRGIILPALHADQGAAMRRLLGRDDATVEAYARMPEIVQQVRAGRHAEAMATIESLPPEVRDNRALMLLRVQCAQALDEKKYLEVIDLLEQRFAGTDQLALVRMDGHILRQNWPLAITCIDKLELALGGDWYLRGMSAMFRAQAGDMAGSALAAREALAGEPETQAIWFSVLSASLFRDDHDETARIMTEMEQRFQLEFNAIDDTPEYARFTASDACARWRAAR